MKKLLCTLLILLATQFSYAENNYGAAKTGLYVSDYGDWYTGVTYQLPDLTKWIVGDIGYLLAMDSGEKSYYILAISLDTTRIFDFNLKKALNVENKVKKWVSLEPGFWVGYDLRTETEHKFAYGLKISLVEYQF